MKKTSTRHFGMFVALRDTAAGIQSEGEVRVAGSPANFLNRRFYPKIAVSYQKWTFIQLSRRHSM